MSNRTMFHGNMQRYIFGYIVPSFILCLHTNVHDVLIGPLEHARIYNPSCWWGCFSERVSDDHQSYLIGFIKRSRLRVSDHFPDRPVSRHQCLGNGCSIQLQIFMVVGKLMILNTNFCSSLNRDHKDRAV